MSNLSYKEIYEQICKDVNKLAQLGPIKQSISLSVDHTKVCKIENCTRPPRAKGYCRGHYERLLKGKDLVTPMKRISSSKNCLLCDSPTSDKAINGLCVNHYKKLRHYVIKTSLIKLFNSRCKLCNQSFSSECYDFHHVNADDKQDTLTIIITGSSLKKIAEEACKCILLCSNCHRTFHSSTKQNYIDLEKLGYYE